MNTGGVPRRVRSRADCRPMSSSARPAETSLTIRAPASTLAAATEARMVSTLTTTSSAASSATTGTTRASSSCSSTRGAPGRVDSPPTSTMLAPWAISVRPWATAETGSSYRPPSEKESGVTFRTPITRVSSPASRAGSPSGQEHAAHRAGDGASPVGSHPPHGHAHVLGLDHHDRAGGADLVHQGVGDLRGDALLHLRPAGIDVDQPGELAEPGDLSRAGDVAHVGDPEERQQVMLAHGVEAEIAHQHQLLVVDVEGGCQRLLGVLVQAEEHLLVHPGHPGGRVLQAFAVWVLADRGEDLPDRGLHARLIDRHVRLPSRPGHPRAGPRGSRGRPHQGGAARADWAASARPRRAPPCRWRWWCRPPSAPRAWAARCWRSTPRAEDAS